MHKVSIGRYAYGIDDIFIKAFGGFAITKKDSKKVQVGKDQEKAQSEKDSHSKNRGGKKPN